MGGDEGLLRCQPLLFDPDSRRNGLVDIHVELIVFGVEIGGDFAELRPAG